MEEFGNVLVAAGEVAIILLPSLTPGEERGKAMNEFKGRAFMFMFVERREDKVGVVDIRRRG